MKKLILIVLCAAIALSLAGCKKAEEPVNEPDPATEAEPAPAQTEPDPEKPAEPEKAEQPTPQMPPQEEIDPDAPLPTGKSTEEVDILPQLDLIAACSDEWFAEQYDGEYNLYAVTDLDGNGRLEIIAANQAGSGLYTWSSYYEVNGTLDGIDMLETNFGEGESQPDLTVDETVCYFDDGVYWFIETDILRNGYAENFLFLSAIAVNGDAVEYRPLGVRRMTYEEVESAEGESEEAEEAEPTITYHDTDGNEITEEQFFDTDRHFPGAEKLTARFCWIEIEPDGDIAAALRESYNQFSVTAAD